MKKAHTKDYQKFLLEQLKESEMAAEYFKAAMEEKDDALHLYKHGLNPYLQYTIPVFIDKTA